MCHNLILWSLSQFSADVSSGAHNVPFVWKQVNRVQTYIGDFLSTQECAKNWFCDSWVSIRLMMSAMVPTNTAKTSAPPFCGCGPIMSPLLIQVVWQWHAKNWFCDLWVSIQLMSVLVPTMSPLHESRLIMSRLTLEIFWVHRNVPKTCFVILTVGNKTVPMFLSSAKMHSYFME